MMQSFMLCYPPLVAGQAKHLECVISLTLLHASLHETSTKGGETHCSILLSGSSCVAQGFVHGPF